MKAIFISYNQAYNEEIVEVLDAHGQRGFTRWENIDGRGSVDGEPHYGNHAWPVQNHAILTFVQDDKRARIKSNPKMTQKMTTTPSIPLPNTEPMKSNGSS